MARIITDFTGHYVVYEDRGEEECGKVRRVDGNTLIVLWRDLDAVTACERGGCAGCDKHWFEVHVPTRIAQHSGSCGCR